jgi:hypothetical protein
MSRPYTLSSEDRALIIVALCERQRNDRECSELASAVNHKAAARAFEEQVDHAESLVGLLEHSQTVDIWPSWRH